MTELVLPPGELLAEHTGNVDFMRLPAVDEVRCRLLDRAARRVEQLAPAGLTRQQRDRLVSFAEDAAIADLSTLDMAILNGIASMSHTATQEVLDASEADQARIPRGRRFRNALRSRRGSEVSLITDPVSDAIERHRERRLGR